MKFFIDQEQKQGITILRIQGDVDLHTSTEVRSALVPIFRRKSKGIIVDLSNVNYLDSSGIATFIEGLQWSNTGQGKFLLSGLSQNVKGIFSIAKLVDVFEIYENSEEALNSLLQQAEN
jgi:anti-sigma B factor antagonist